MNLAHGSTANYKGNHNLRSELRRLRSIGLLCMRPNQQMSFIKDGMTVELANYVELTSLGQKWVRRIEDAESAEAKAAAAGIDSRSRAG